MEQRHPNQQQTDQWRAALLAPLGRQAVQEPMAEHEGAASSGAEETPADLPDSEPATEADETARPARRRAVATAAIGQVLANVYHDPVRHTVTLLLDEQHATAVIYAIRALAADFEAHAREVRAVAANMPLDSYGHANRQFIAIRHERLASRLRRVESNYRTEISEGGMPAD
jgi:hypothetical protein